MLRHSLLCPSVVNLALDVIYVVISRYNRTPHTKAVYRQKYIKKAMIKRNTQYLHPTGIS